MLRRDPYGALTENRQLFWKRLLASGVRRPEAFRRVNGPGGPARSSWWRSLFHSHGVARGDVAGGLTAAVVLLAIEGSYGLIAYARLGPEQAQLGFVLGVCTAALASATMLAVGGRGPLLSGSTAALSLLVPALIGALVIDPRFIAPDGRPAIPLLLAFVAFGTVLAGHDASLARLT